MLRRNLLIFLGGLACGLMSAFVSHSGHIFPANPISSGGASLAVAEAEQKSSPVFHKSFPGPVDFRCELHVGSNSNAKRFTAWTITSTNSFAMSAMIGHLKSREWLLSVSPVSYVIGDQRVTREEYEGWQHVSGIGSGSLVPRDPSALPMTGADWERYSRSVQSLKPVTLEGRLR